MAPSPHALLVVAVLVCAGCGEARPVSAPPREAGPHREVRAPAPSEVFAGRWDVEAGVSPRRGVRGPAYVVFTGRQVGGYDGCNGFGRIRWARRGDRLRLVGGIWTTAACAGDYTTLGRALDRTRYWRMDGDRFELLSSKRRVLVVFARPG